MNQAHFKKRVFLAGFGNLGKGSTGSDRSESCLLLWRRGCPGQAITAGSSPTSPTSPAQLPQLEKSLSLFSFCLQDIPEITSSSPEDPAGLSLMARLACWGYPSNHLQALWKGQFLSQFPSRSLVPKRPLSQVPIFPVASSDSPALPACPQPECKF